MSAAHGAGPAEPTGVLVNLDGYMAAAGYGADHPWRREIGAALRPAPQAKQQGISSVVLRTPYGRLYINHTEENEHADMRAKQLAGLLALMSGADGSDDMLRLAAKLSAEAGEAIRMLCSQVPNIGDAALASRQIAQLLLLIQPEEGADDMLWLAIQLANELAGTIAGVSAVGGAS